MIINQYFIDVSSIQRFYKQWQTRLILSMPKEFWLYVYKKLHVLHDDYSSFNLTHLLRVEFT